MADTKRVILCPACGAVMTKIYVPEANIDIDFCIDGCGGIFFDNRELDTVKDLDKTAEEIIELAHSKFYNAVDESLTRYCPVCHVPMRKYMVDFSDLEIDTCDSCGGKFLDNQEFQKVCDFDSLTSLWS